VIEKDTGDKFGNIWITSRTRMQAHSRYLGYDLLSHVVLTSYSVILLAFSVFSDHLLATKIGPYLTEVSIVLSLSVLCASLVIWGLKFGKTADQHRDCYLALQKLYEDQERREENSAYHKILEQYPNHSTFDYEAMLYKQVWSHGKTVEDREGAIAFGNFRWLKFLLVRLLRLIAAAVLVTFPLLFLAAIYVGS